jgi:hypothetical protein
MKVQFRKQGGKIITGNAMRYVWAVLPFPACDTCPDGDGWITRQHTIDPCHADAHPRCSASCCSDPIPREGIVAVLRHGNKSEKLAWCGLDCLHAWRSDDECAPGEFYVLRRGAEAVYGEVRK